MRAAFSNCEASFRAREIAIFDDGPAAWRTSESGFRRTPGRADRAGSV